MKEELITFKTAKLAKEKGFFYGIDFYDIQYVYNDSGYLIEVNDSSIDEEDILASTQSLLQKWLRENHKLDVLLYLEDINCYVYHVWGETGRIVHSYLTYEEALEAGLQEALKLIP